MGNDRFSEYREVKVSEPLRQGDVLESVNANESMWQRNLLVITADCDFANDKHQGRVTCVPILAADEYLSELQIPRIRDQLVKKYLSGLRAELATVGAPNISSKRLREWASEEEPALIVESLGLEGVGASKVEAALNSIRLADMPSPTLSEAASNLVEASMMAPNPPKRDNAVKTIAERIRSAYSQPPGDALFLSAIGPNHDAGYFAYLRHLEQIWQPEISTAPTRRGVKYRRISKLQDRFTHALVQRFAMVFMSIGLPEEYVDLRDLHSELMGNFIQ
jgi:hypothetical protein